MYKLNKDNITAHFESLTNFRYSSNVFVFKHHLNALSFFYRSDRQSLLHKIQVLEHQVNNVSMGSSMSSQTQVLDWEQHRQTGRQVQHKHLLD